MKAYNLRKYDTQRDMKNLFRVYSDYSEQYKLFSVMSIHNYDSFVELFRRQADRYTEFNIIEVDKMFAGFVAA